MKKCTSLRVAMGFTLREGWPRMDLEGVKDVTCESLDNSFKKFSFCKFLGLPVEGFKKEVYPF